MTILQAIKRAIFGNYTSRLDAKDADSTMAAADKSNTEMTQMEEEVEEKGKMDEAGDQDTDAIDISQSELQSELSEAFQQDIAVLLSLQK
jgi:hypothetical protein